MTNLFQRSTSYLFPDNFLYLSFNIVIYNSMTQFIQKRV